MNRNGILSVKAGGREGVSSGSSMTRPPSCAVATICSTPKLKGRSFAHAHRPSPGTMVAQGPHLPSPTHTPAVTRTPCSTAQHVPLSHTCPPPPPCP